MAEEDKKQGNKEPQVVTVGDKTYGAEEIQALIENGVATKAQLEALAPVQEALTRYELDPAGLIEQATGAFSVLNQLVEQGLIDETGKIKEPPKKKEGDSPKDKVNIPKSGGDNQEVMSKINFLEQTLAKVNQSLQEIDKTQSSILRTNIEKEIRSKYPSLDSDDVSKVLLQASKDRKKDIFTHAEEASNRKTQTLSTLRAAHAKEFGINLEEFDTNKLNEPGSEKGAAGFFKGKKFSFGKKGKDVISPSQAAREYYRKLEQS